MIVDVQIVQPGTCHDLRTVRGQHHDAIAGLCAEFPGRFFGMANPSPHLPPEVYADEVARCFLELGFTSIKLHPMAHGVNPASRDRDGGSSRRPADKEYRSWFTRARALPSRTPCPCTGSRRNTRT
jgi:predicted TIM-barrel fold metal-dependent hydrolase